MPMYSNENNLISFVPRWKGFRYGKKARHNDQIAGGSCKSSFKHRSKTSGKVFSKSFQTRLHSTTAFRNPGTTPVLSDGLPGHTTITPGFLRPAKNAENNQNTALHNAAKSVD